MLRAGGRARAEYGRGYGAACVAATDTRVRAQARSAQDTGWRSQRTHATKVCVSEQIVRDQLCAEAQVSGRQRREKADGAEDAP